MTLHSCRSPSLRPARPLNRWSNIYSKHLLRVLYANANAHNVSGDPADGGELRPGAASSGVVDDGTDDMSVVVDKKMAAAAAPCPGSYSREHHFIGISDPVSIGVWEGALTQVALLNEPCDVPPTAWVFPGCSRRKGCWPEFSHARFLN